MPDPQPLSRRERFARLTPFQTSVEGGNELGLGWITYLLLLTEYLCEPASDLLPSPHSLTIPEMSRRGRESARTPIPGDQQPDAFACASCPLSNLAHGHEVVWLKVHDPSLRDHRLYTLDRGEYGIGERFGLTIEVHVLE
jgi:hypothetical protein